jgi:hypothetical protein
MVMGSPGGGEQPVDVAERESRVGGGQPHRAGGELGGGAPVHLAEVGHAQSANDGTATRGDIWRTWHGGPPLSSMVRGAAILVRELHMSVL